MDPHSVARWAWRLAALAALLWIGYTLHRIEQQLPSGMDYDTERAIQSIERDVDTIRRQLGHGRN